jgi:hypothetical protein
MDYLDFTIEASEISELDGGKRLRYVVRVIEEMRPEEAVTITCEVRQLQRMLDQLERRELEAAGLMEIGRNLAALLLPIDAVSGKPSIREMLARRLLSPGGTGVRLRLRLPRLLAGLPWEYAYVERAGGDGMDGFLALDPRVAFVRDDVLGTVPITPLGGDLRIVAALASAADLPELDLHTELQGIVAAVKDIPGLTLTAVEDATLDRVQAALAGAQIFHFAGHGDFTREMGASPGTYTGTGSLAFDDTRVNAEQLGVNLHGQDVRLAVLGGCETGRRAGVSVWSGIAPALTKVDVPAVVANQYTITDTAALAFSRRFYQALAGGLPVERAVSDGRLAIYNQAPGERDWGVPVLYLRAANGALFEGVSNRELRERTRAAAEADIVVRTGKVGPQGIVYGAKVRERLAGKLSISVTTGDVSGKVIGFTASGGEGVTPSANVTTGDVSGEVVGGVIGAGDSETHGNEAPAEVPAGQQARRANAAETGARVEEPAPSAHDFSSLIADRTRHFSGREWVFARINQWLGDPKGSRIFLLAGGPGTGKTAIAARLAQVSAGTVRVPACDQLRPGFLTYMHFCQAGLDSTLSQIAFVQTLSEALANAFPSFREALEQQASRHIVMSPVVSTGTVQPGGSVTGMVVKKVQLEIHGDDARSMFDVAVRRPLLAHAWAHPEEGAVILVDSLDEALTFSKDRSIAHLMQLVNDFPPHVRFVLTARSNSPRVAELVGPPSVDLIRDAPPGVDEVKTYALARLGRLPEERRSELAAKIAAKSQGNFLFAYHVLNQALATPGTEVEDVEIPDELDGVYRAFLKRELAATGEQWSARFRPLLGTIAVARGEALTRAHLAGITCLTGAAIDDVLHICREYLLGGDTPQQGLRIYHYSFQEFLLTDPTYNVYPSERHEAIGAYFVGVHGKSWRKCQDVYALRYTPFHLAEAARGSESTRDGLIRTLVELTGNESFQRQCEAVLRDVPLIQEHFMRALTATTLSPRDEMLSWVVRAWKSLAAFRRKFLTGESVIALARAGDIATAEGRLAMFDGLDRDWRVAASLIIAWLACDAQPAGSREVVERLAPTAAADPLPLLVARICAAQNGETGFSIDAQKPETPEVGRALVRRLSGQTFDAELLHSRGMNVSTGLAEQTELVDAGEYAATLDGPVLVNSAREYGAEADANVDAYIDAHAGYNYVEYRNRSLWVLLHAVLRHHPQQAWVRDRVGRLLEAALAAGGAEFTEMAPAVATALLERLQAGGASPIVDAIRTAARAATETLLHGRGANDSWSLHRRRLTMLMELETLICNNVAGASAVSDDIQMLERARVLDGFAGFRAPAELRLADAMRLCGREPSAVGDRLATALKTAHHIQDYHFCARITARCNTLVRWHGETLPAALAATIDRLVTVPAAVEFSADHVIGETFRFRDESETDGKSSPSSRFPMVMDDHMLPVWEATQADSLGRLADVFQRPALEFVRLNPNSGLQATIAAGVQVHVPDPGLAPLLASHFAARALAQTSLGLERARLIRSLLPVASANNTAFDTVLAYLLIASDPEDSGVLGEVVAQLGAPVLATESASAFAPQQRGIPS